MLRVPAVIPQLTIGRPTSQLLQNLSIGQTVRAQVLQGTPPEQGGGRALLLIGRAALSVRAQTPLQAGSTLTLRVTELGSRIGLQVVERARVESSLPRAEPLLRRLVPQQAGAGPLYNTVAARPAPPGTSSQLQAAWQGLRQAMPKTETATQPQGLKQAIRDSGVFLEAKLMNGGPQPSLQGDLKAAALRLLSALVRQPPGTAMPQPGQRPSPLPVQSPPPPIGQAVPVPQPRVPVPAEMMSTALQFDSLRQMLESAVARMNLHQLVNSGAHQPEGTQSWLLEVPIQDGEGVDILHLRIRDEERQDGRDGAPERVWSVELALDLPGLGPLRARIQLLGESVSTAFWAEDEATAGRIDRELPRLRAALEARELEVAAMSASAGAPDEIAPGGSDGGLLDTRA